MRHNLPRIIGRILMYLVLTLTSNIKMLEGNPFSTFIQHDSVTAVNTNRHIIWTRFTLCLHSLTNLFSAVRTITTVASLLRGVETLEIVTYSRSL
jgi:hypothetical protein